MRITHWLEALSQSISFAKATVASRPRSPQASTSLEQLEDRSLLTVDLVSAGIPGAYADSMSEGPAISTDGHSLAFHSLASNLVSGDTNGSFDVFVKNLQTGTITRVSTDAFGTQANNGSEDPSISSDGRYVAFQSGASNLVSGDSNNSDDIFVKDLQTGAITRVSTDSSDAEANSHSENPSISADGRYVAFISTASNLVSGDTNGRIDVFVKDLQTGILTRISTDAANAQANAASSEPAISGDGLYVAFTSSATNLVSGDTNGRTDVFVKELQTGIVTRVSTDAGNAQGNQNSSYPSISSSGRYVAFNSAATNLVSGDTNATGDVFVKDLQTGSITRVSTNAANNQGNADSSQPSISNDGRYVAFTSSANNLVSGDTNGQPDVFVKDLQTGTISRASTDASGTEADADSYDAALSGDGSTVAFSSNASNLVSGDTNFLPDVFVKDIVSSSLTLASTFLVGLPGSGDFDSYEPSTSSDGRYVAFYSYATNLVSNDTNYSADIFVHDLQMGTITRVSTDAAGNEADSESYSPSISSDGRYVAFYSYASNLVSGDTNGTSDIFVKDLQTGSVTRVSTDASGAESNGGALAPAISSDGRFVAFPSDASDLVNGDTNSKYDIFVKDLQTGAITRISTDTANAQANADSYAPSISGDGRYVAFHSSATNLFGSDTNGQEDVFVKDLQTGTLTRVSNNASGVQGNSQSVAPSISSDGRYVAFSSHSSNLVSGDTNGRYDVFVKDLQTGAVTLVSTDVANTPSDGESSKPSISSDGRYVGFESTASNLISGDTNNFPDVFVKDLQTGIVTRVSTDAAGNEGTSDSYEPSISGDGRYVAISSYAANLSPDDRRMNSDVFRVSLFSATIGATLDGSGNLELTDATGAANEFTITVTGGNLVISDSTQQFTSAPAGWTLDPGGLSISIPLGSFSGSITINGGSGDDTFTLDYAGGNPVPTGGLYFDGGLGHDNLNIDADGLAIVFGLNDSVAQTGTISVGGGPTITYAGIEPNTVTITDAATVTLDLSGGDTVTFTEVSATRTRAQGGSNAVEFDNPTTQLVINASDGLGYTLNFDDLAADFNPTNGIEINGNSGVESVTVTDLGDSFSGTLDIDLAGGTDSVLFQTNDQMFSTLSLKAETITATSAALEVSGATTLDANSTGTITLTNAANDFGSVTSTAGTMTIEDVNDIVLGTTAITSTFDVTAGGTITQTGTVSATTLTTSSVGGTTLNLANTVTGFNATNTTSGDISLTNTAATLTITGISQSGGGNVMVNNTGAITTSGAITTAANGNIGLTSSGTQTLGAAVTAGGSGTVTLSANGDSDILVNAAVSSTSGAISLTAGRNVSLTAAVSTTTSVGITAVDINSTNAGTISTGTGLTLTNTGTASTLSGVISGSGGGTKLGTGTILLHVANNYTGVTNVNNGTLALDVNGALGSTAGNTIVNAGGTLDVRNTIYSILEALSLNGGTLQTSTGTSEWMEAVSLAASSTVDVSGTQLTISDVISGGAASNVAKTGVGILFMTASNTYSGVTNVNAGTLYVQGTNNGMGAVNVNNSAILGGTGTITGSVNVLDTSRLSPGVNGPGRLTIVDSLTFGPNAFFDVQLNGLTSGTQYDQVVVNNGGVDLGGVNGATLVPTLGFGAVPYDRFTLINKLSNGAVVGSYQDHVEGGIYDVSAKRLRVSYGEFHNTTSVPPTPIFYGNGNDVSLTVMTPPLVITTSVNGNLTIDGTGWNDDIILSFTGTNQLTIIGNDVSNFTGPGTSNSQMAGPYTVTGNITVKLGNGKDKVLLRGVGANATFDGGNLSIDLGADDDAVTTIDSALLPVATSGLKLTGNLSIIGGSGVDNVTLGSVAANDTITALNVNIDTGTGDGATQTISLDRFTANGNVTLTNGGSAGQIVAIGSNALTASNSIGGNLIINQLASASGYTVGVHNTDVDGFVTITNGNGSGAAAVTIDSTAASTSSHTIGGATTITNGNNNSNAVSLIGNVTIPNFLTLAGNITVKNGNAGTTNTITVTDIVNSGTTSSSFTNGSSPANTITFSGADAAIPYNSFLGQVTATNGASNGANLINATRLSSTKGINLVNGTATNTNDINIGGAATADLVDVTGNLVITNGASADIDVNVDNLSTHGPVNSGNVTMTNAATGAGGTTIDFGANAPNDISGNLQITNQTSTGTRSVTLNQTDVRGRTGVNIYNVGAGNTSLTIGDAVVMTINNGLKVEDGSGTAALSLQNLTVGSFDYKDQGGGADTLDLANSAGTLQINGVTRIDTAGGSDTVAIATTGTAIFNDTVFIALGAGDDILTIGDNASSPAFDTSGRFQFDGGTGNDTLNASVLSLADYQPGSPLPKKLRSKIANFEHLN